jgi:hypothetical protein
MSKPPRLNIKEASERLGLSEQDLLWESYSNNSLLPCYTFFKGVSEIDYLHDRPPEETGHHAFSKKTINFSEGTLFFLDSTDIKRLYESQAESNETNLFIPDVDAGFDTELYDQPLPIHSIRKLTIEKEYLIFKLSDIEKYLSSKSGNQARKPKPSANEIRVKIIKRWIDTGPPEYDKQYGVDMTQVDFWKLICNWSGLADDEKVHFFEGRESKTYRDTLKKITTILENEGVTFTIKPLLGETL